MSSKLKNILIALVAGIVLVSGFVFFTPYGEKFKTHLPSVSSVMDFVSNDQGVFYPKVKTLDNGLEVIVVENHRAPIVNHMLWFKVGSADEEQGKSGLAHFLEHLVFGPTSKLERGDYDKYIDSIGGQVNAFTSHDFTAYFVNMAKEHLRSVMEIERERMENLKFDQTFFDSEKEVIFEEWNYRVGNNPSRKFHYEAIPVLFKGHPYGRDVLGIKSDLQRLKLEDAKEYFERWYAPNNATLIVSGDVIAEEIFAMAEEAYGGWPHKEVPERRRTLPDPLQANVRVEYRDPLQTKEKVYFMYLVPSESQDLVAALALDLITEVIADKSAYLQEELVINNKILSHLSAGYSSSNEDNIMFKLSGQPAEKVDLEAASEKLKKVFSEFVDQGIDKKTFQDAKKRFKNSVYYARDSLMYPGYAFGIARTTGATVEDVEDWPNRVDKMTLEKVNQVLKTYFQDTHFVEGFLLPEKSTKTQSKAE